MVSKGRKKKEAGSQMHFILLPFRFFSLSCFRVVMKESFAFYILNSMLVIIPSSASGVVSAIHFVVCVSNPAAARIELS